MYGLPSSLAQFPAELEEPYLRAVHHSLVPRLDDLVTVIYDQFKPLSVGKENTTQASPSRKRPQLSKKVLKRWIQEVSTHLTSNYLIISHRGHSSVPP